MVLPAVPRRKCKLCPFAVPAHGVIYVYIYTPPPPPKERYHIYNFTPVGTATLFGACLHIRSNTTHAGNAERRRRR